MRRVGDCLNERMQTLYQQSSQLTKLTKTVNHFIPQELRSCCQVASFIQGSLTLTVSNADWATQLRYYLPELRDKLRRDAGLYQLTAIKLTIADNVKPIKIKPIKKSLLSAKARDAIHTSGDECDYLPLKEALHNLAGKK